jgi:putative addiction module component (TIGR02574 family)
VSIDSPALDSVVQQALKLPLPERVEVLHRLWDSLPADSGSVFLSEDLLQELDRRTAYEDEHPDDDLTWEEVKAGVRQKR